jgi:spermidine synthase
VEVIEGDVFAVIRAAGPAAYDAILLDVDNGPTSFVQAENARLYGRRGFALIRAALRAEGRVAFWSACEERGFVQSLARAGFAAEAVPCKAHERAKRLAHVIYVAQRREEPAPPPEATRAPGFPGNRRSRR